MAELIVKNLAVEFQTATRIIRAVRDVSFSVASGERVALVGESGSGKTTTALALMQMIDPPGRIVSGTAHLGGQDLLSLRGDEVRAARLSRVSYIPQGAMNSLNPVMTIGQQIADGLADHGERLSKEKLRSRIVEVLTSVGLDPDVRHKYPHQLSGGMKQRVCIAIGIVMQPQLIIADEPTSALDVITQKTVMSTLIEAQEKVGCGLILIGHDMGLMAQATHRVVVMRDGIIAEDAAVGSIFRNPQHAYSRQLIDSVPRLGGRENVSASERAASQSAAPLLAFDKVSKTFGGGVLGGNGVQALHPTSFELSAESPQIVSVVGQSGSGKTTLARMILGLETPSSGTIRIAGRDLSAIRGAEHQVFRKDVQAIFQDPYGSFNPFYKVDRALAAPLRRFGEALGNREIYARMEEACTSVGLDAREVLGRFPHELSGGQRQRLMVARALLLRPKLLVADEPVSMVDASLRMTILRNLRDLRDKHGISIIYITHDLATAYHVSDFVMVLHRGRVVEAGPPEPVIERPEHPYTRSLVASIPWPEPGDEWRNAMINRDGWDLPLASRGASRGFELEATL